MISEPVLLHLHIPKAGGKTIQDVLYSIYADGNDVPYEAKHVNLSGDQEIAAKSRKLIQNFNQLDIELYQFADGLLSEMSDTRVCVTS